MLIRVDYVDRSWWTRRPAVLAEGEIAKRKEDRGAAAEAEG